MTAGSTAPAATSPSLEARGLAFAFGGRRVLDGVDACFSTGWTAIVGPNGAGKSTLLRCLAGLLQPSAGGVWIGGEPLAQLSPRARGRRLAWLAQAGETTGELSAGDTVALGRLPHLGVFGTPGGADRAAVQRAMERTACTDWQHRLLPQLSGGERQRVLLARALAAEAPVLLLDEPTTHLDPPHQVALVRLARALGATHTVVTVLHDLSLALAADRVLLLAAGRVRAEGAAADPALHAAIAEAFGGAVRIDWRDGRAAVLPLV